MGLGANLARLSLGIQDAVTSRAIRAIEDALRLLESRINAAGTVGSSTGPAGTGVVRVTGGVYGAPAELSGDVSTAGALATAIGANKVLLSMMAQLATSRILGRVTAGTGNVEAMTGTQTTTLLDTMT